MRLQARCAAFGEQRQHQTAEAAVASSTMAPPRSLSAGFSKTVMGVFMAAAMAGFGVVVKPFPVPLAGSSLNCRKFGSLCPSTSARI